jgi:hypothetical protein
MVEIRTYTDKTGRKWRVHEFVSYAEKTPPPGELPTVVGAAIVFESDDERRIADNAPIDWRAQPGALEALFARARAPEPQRLRDAP